MVSTRPGFRGNYTLHNWIMKSAWRAARHWLWGNWGCFPRPFQFTPIFGSVGNQDTFRQWRYSSIHRILYFNFFISEKMHRGPVSFDQVVHCRRWPAELFSLVIAIAQRLPKDFLWCANLACVAYNLACAIVRSLYLVEAVHPTCQTRARRAWLEHGSKCTNHRRSHSSADHTDQSLIVKSDQW